MRASGAIVCSGVIDGTSIVSANVFFALSNSSTNAPADTAFTYDDFPPLNAGNYVWQATKITDSDGKTSLTGKICLGPTTDFLSGTEVYAISTSNSAAPAENTTNWKTTYEKTKGYYLWTATRVQYTNGNYAYLNKKCVGYWGEDGKGISSADIMFCLGDSQTQAPGDSSFTVTTFAGLNISSTDANKFVWQCIKTTYTSGDPTYSGKVCLGKVSDFASVVEQYALGSASEATSSWQNNTPPPAEKGKYLWTRTKLTYSGGGTTYIPSEAGQCVGYFGNDGATGYSIALTLIRNNLYTDANWNTYAELGHSENYSKRTGDSDFTACRVSDYFVVTGTSSDSGKNHSAIYKCTSVNTNSITGTCVSHTKDGEKGDDAVTYDIVLNTAWAKVDSSGTITAGLAGTAYKIVGSTRSVLTSTMIRYGYILNDSTTYADTTTDGSGNFDAGTWFNNGNQYDYAKGSNSIFAAIVIGGSVKCVKYVTIANQGNKGDTGRMYYIAGKFPEKAKYTRTAKLCPVVYYSPYWWYLDADSATGSDTPSNSNSSKWKKLENYGVVLTDAIFVKEFAQFGAAIITRDWLISVWGKIYDEYGDKTDVDSGSVTEPFYYPSESSTPAYTYFNPDYPNSSAPNVVNFVPNYAVDLKTGKSYQNDGEFNGVIKAKSMYLEYQEAEVEEVIDPSRGAGIGIPFSYIGQNIYLPLASEYPFITLTFYKYFDASTIQTIARICASGNEEIYTNTELLNNYHYHTYCKSFYPPSNTVIRLHAINGKWCLDCDESKILAFYDDNGNTLTKKE